MYYLITALLAAVTLLLFITVLPDGAGKKIRRFLIEVYRKLASVPQSEYTPDCSLAYKLAAGLEKFSYLTAEYTRWTPGTFSNYRIPCIIMAFSPKNGKEDFPAVREIFKNIFAEHMFELGIFNYRLNIAFQQKSTCHYEIYVCYATTEENINAYEQFSEARRRAMERKAAESAAPPIDRELEQELRGAANDGNQH